VKGYAVVVIAGIVAAGSMPASAQTPRVLAETKSRSNRAGSLWNRSRAPATAALNLTPARKSAW